MQPVEGRLEHGRLGDHVFVQEVGEVLQEPHVDEGVPRDVVAQVHDTAKFEKGGGEGVVAGILFLDALLGVDGLLERGNVGELEPEVEAEPHEEVALVDRVAQNHGNLEERDADGGLVAFAVVVVDEFGLVVVAAVAEVQLHDGRKSAVADVHLRDQAAGHLDTQVPVFGVMPEGFVDARSQAEAQLDGLGEAFAARAGDVGVLVDVAVVGVVVLVVVACGGGVAAFGEQGIGGGAVFLVVCGACDLGLLFGRCGRGVAFCCLGRGFVAAVTDAGGGRLVVAVVHFRAAAVLRGNPCGIHLGFVLLREGESPEKGQYGECQYKLGVQHAPIIAFLRFVWNGFSKF